MSAVDRVMDSLRRLIWAGSPAVCVLTYALQNPGLWGLICILFAASWAADGVRFYRRSRDQGWDLP